MDISTAHRVAVEAAEAAGAKLLEGVAGEVAVSAKAWGTDVVTNLEPSAERLIIDRIRHHFPAHGIEAEEAGALEGTDPGHVWVVDPLDGSSNVAIGLHTYVVGIALCEQGVPLLGVVRDPVAGRTWSAIRGRGTYGFAPASSRHACGRTIAWTQGHRVGRDDPTARSLRMVLESRVRRVLQLWAPLVCWVMLAGGSIDGFVGYRAEPWEMPAGTILARERGVEIRNHDGAAFDERAGSAIAPRSFVAARVDMIDELLDLVRRADAMRPGLERLLRGG